MNDYHRWHHLPENSALTDLMARDRLENWLYRLFLKIAMPVHKTEI